MIDLDTLKPVYDFSLIEKAVQTYFCRDDIGKFVAPPTENGPGWDERETWNPAARIPIFTAFETLLWKKQRPRVGIDLNGINEVARSWVIDADQALRAKSWNARLTFGIVTEPSYTLHTQLRALVSAIIPQLGPRFEPDRSGVAAGGINQYLQLHQLATIAATDNSTRVTPQDGIYFSPINCAVTFSVRPSAWPGGTINQ
jgi:hypothetical protein